MNDVRAKELTEMAQQGIKLLTSWTTAVMELVCDCRLYVYVCTMYVCMYVHTFVCMYV